MNLKPVLVKRDASAGNTFLLTDGAGGYFLWNEIELEMYRFRNKNLRAGEVVDKVRNETYSNEELVRQFWNPIGRDEES
jgi:hypothetical protein